MYTCSAAASQNRPAAHFSNLTSLELPAAALGGIGVHKNYDLFGIVDNLEFQNATILLHQEDKEDINRLVLKLLKNLMSKNLRCQKLYNRQGY